MHNSLQGDPQAISDQQWEVFEAYNVMNAQTLEGEWDVIIVHDPQPAGMQAQRRRPRRGDWIWRCHIDLSAPNPSTIERLKPLITDYDASVWHLQQYVPEGLDGGLLQDLPAGDRPAVAEEHGALARGRRLRLRAVRDRHRPAADLPGLALRPVEGPDGGDRRLPPGRASRSPTRSSPWSARWRPTTPRAGSSSTAPSATPTATPTSRSSTTSTTSARSRSTRSSRRPTSACRSRSARASG